MTPQLSHLPSILVLLAAVVLLAHGPVEQLAHYHDFADQRRLLGLRNGANVLSNLGFVALAFWGWRGVRENPRLLNAGWPGYRLFLLALLLTGVGSAYYHLAPSDPRLVWDRLPIALACAGLLAGVHGDVRPVQARRYPITTMLGAAALASVLWWVASGDKGYGDLRPYLLLQALPLVLVPLWHWIYYAPREDKRAFGLAIALYAAAKLAELGDHQLFAITGLVSGHTAKHLAATAAAAVIVARIRHRCAYGSGVPVPA